MNKQTKSYLLGLKHGKSHTAKVKTFKTTKAKADYNAGYKAGRCSKTFTVKNQKTILKESVDGAFRIYKTLFKPSNNWLETFDTKRSIVSHLVQEGSFSSEAPKGTDIHERYQIKKSFNRA
jgi:hypothetical protein